MPEWHQFPASRVCIPTDGRYELQGAMGEVCTSWSTELHLMSVEGGCKLWRSQWDFDHHRVALMGEVSSRIWCVGVYLSSGHKTR